jgi:hypothetical protein
VVSARPKVNELSFQLFGRSLHPELFEVYRSQTIEHEKYVARIEITGSGHVVSWQHAGQWLTEVSCSAQHPLPQRRKLMGYRLRGQKNDRVECRGGVVYHVNFELEAVTPAVLQLFHQELAHEGEREGLFHSFASSGRMALGGQSFIHVETRKRGLLVKAFHTFPDDCAVVKSQSLFELPS